MKNRQLYNKLISLIGTSLCLYPNKTSDFLKTTKTTNEILIEAKLQNPDFFKHIPNQVENTALTDYLKQLNQTEIYLIVTESNASNIGNPILLLLEPLNFFQSKKAHLERQYRYVYFGLENGLLRDNLSGLKEPDQALVEILKLLYLGKEESLISNYSLIADRITNSRFYNINNLGGSKSICPVFFDKNSAEDFYIKNSERKFKSSAHNMVLANKVSKGFYTSSVSSNKKAIQGLADSKIIAVGLGDFINYYSSSLTQNFLAETEFLFFPRLNNIESYKKPQNERIPTKETFRFYQKMYCKLKS